MIPTPEKYIDTAKKAVADPVLQKALTGLQERFGRGTALAYQQLPEGPDLRHVAHDIRMHAIQHLDSLLDELAGKFRKNGGQVYFAQDATEAVAYCLKVAEANNVRRVVKGKSMVTEEIRLNAALTDAGIETAYHIESAAESAASEP